MVVKLGAALGKQRRDAAGRELSGRRSERAGSEALVEAAEVRVPGGVHALGVLAPGAVHLLGVVRVGAVREAVLALALGHGRRQRAHGLAVRESADLPGQHHPLKCWWVMVVKKREDDEHTACTEHLTAHAGRRDVPCSGAEPIRATGYITNATFPRRPTPALLKNTPTSNHAAVATGCSHSELTQTGSWLRRSRPREPCGLGLLLSPPR